MLGVYFQQAYTTFTFKQLAGKSKKFRLLLETAYSRTHPIKKYYSIENSISLFLFG